MSSNVSKGKQKYGGKSKGKKKGKAKDAKLSPYTTSLIRAIARNATKTALARNVEVKGYNLNLVWHVSADENQHCHNLTSMAQGTGMGQRTGNRVTLKAARLTYWWEIPPTGWTGDEFNTIRLMVFQYKLSGTANVPTFDEITHSATADVFIRTIDLEQRKNIVLLYDKTTRLVAPTSANSSANYKIYNGSHYFRDDVKLDLRYCAKDIRYDDDGATNGDNHLWMVAVSDSTVTNHPAMYIHTEVLYTDM